MELQQAVELSKRVQNEIKKSVKGKDDCIRKAFCAILAGGHILIEDVPGVGKTTLALAFSRALCLENHRVQFTPDVLPADILGFSMYDKEQGGFYYHPGAVMCNLFLADEINRTSPKTQSALLEVMEEGKVTVDGISHPVPKPFLVMATQNPKGSAGTQMLPESQLDRFMVCLSMGYPSHADAVAILKGNAGKPLSKVQEVISMEEVLALRAMTNDLYVKDEIYEYIVNLVEATRTMEIFSMGASPRGTIALLRMAKAMAVIDGRDYVCAKDVQDVARDVLGHRVKLSARGKAQGITMQQAIGMEIEY